MKPGRYLPQIKRVYDVDIVNPSNTVHAAVGPPGLGPGTLRILCTGLLLYQMEFVFVRSICEVIPEFGIFKFYNIVIR